MEVVDHEPAGWYLLTEGADHYFDVNCSHSAVGFSILLRFDDDERARYHAQGRAFLERFAEEVNYYSGRYRSRDVTGALAHEAGRAIATWQRERAVRPPGT
jgi:hypothetical protein